MLWVVKQGPKPQWAARNARLAGRASLRSRRQAEGLYDVELIFLFNVSAKQKNAAYDFWRKLVVRFYTPAACQAFVKDLNDGSS